MTPSEIENLLRDAGLSRYWPSLKPHLRPALVLETERAEQDLPTGSSKLGGEPDLPPGAIWPVTATGLPLRFLGQLNLAEIGQYVDFLLLPKTGLLSFFFHDMFDHTYRDPEADEENERSTPAVLYTPDVQTCQWTKPLAPIYPVCRLRYRKMEMLPQGHSTSVHDLEGFRDNLIANVQAYTDVETRMEEGDEHLLMGYPGWHISEEEIQTSIIREKYGLSDGDSLPSDLEEGAQNWIPLARFGFDDNLAWYWGKGGTLHFMINRSALERRDFGDIHVINDFV